MKNILILIFIITLINISYSDTIDIQFSFDPDKVILEKEMGYDTVNYPDAIKKCDLGKPDLPITSVYISIPFESIIDSISIVSSQTQDIEGEFFILPAQKPKPIGEYTTESNFVLPDPSIYNIDQFYPQNPYSEPFISSFNGADMCEIIVYPFRYNPVDRHLEIYTSLTLRLNYTPPSPTPSPVRHMEDRNKNMIIDIIKKEVYNPYDVEDNFEPLYLYSLSESQPQGYNLNAPDPNDTTSLPSDMQYPYTYVIITNDRYYGFLPTSETEDIPLSCSPLEIWRDEIGVPATLRTVQWIKENYQESQTEDIQKAIRDFLADAWTYWGTQWLILVGDVNLKLPYPSQLTEKSSHGFPGIVPVRFLCTFDYGWKIDSNYVKMIVNPIGNQFYNACDLYYMNVTDDFDKDGDEFYGEPEHDILNTGFKYDINIFGGRVPADTETEVESFITKLLHYEKLDFVLPPSGTYLSKCLQVSADFGNYAIKTLKDDNYLPMFTIKNMYEGFYNDIDNPDNYYERYPDYPEPWQVVEEIDNNTPGIINFAEHGRHDGYLLMTHKYEDVIWPTATIQWISTCHKYTNFYVHSWNYDKTFEDINISPKYSFLYSYACSSNHYDDDYKGVVGEEFLFNQNWGGPSIIGNIRLGWAYSGERLMDYYYNLLMNKTITYEDDISYVGISQCNTLKYFWSLSIGYLNDIYVNQLFGCPRTSIWRGDPQLFDISTQVIHNPDDTYSLVVTVRDSSSENPVENASVCLWMKFEVPSRYFVKTTDSNGNVEFNVGSGCSNASLTTSYDKFNYKPYQTTITIP